MVLPAPKKPVITLVGTACIRLLADAGCLVCGFEISGPLITGFMNAEDFKLMLVARLVGKNLLHLSQQVCSYSGLASQYERANLFYKNSVVTIFFFVPWQPPLHLPEPVEQPVKSWLPAAGETEKGQPEPATEMPGIQTVPVVTLRRNETTES